MIHLRLQIVYDKNVIRLKNKTLLAKLINELLFSSTDFVEQPSTSRSTPLSRHTSNFRYVDVNSRPLLWCSTPAPPNDYPSPYATLPLRPTPISKRWQSEDGMSPPASERSESLINQVSE